ncbi:hypothetical protein MY10362_007192 [Beauveria mimosiformis]
MMYSLSSVVMARELMILGSFGEATCVPRARSFIYVLPDGYESVSKTVARDFESIMPEQSTRASPIRRRLALVVGMVRTQANDNLVTKSDACATALACDYCAQVLDCNSEIKFAAQQIGYTNPFGAYLGSSLGSGRQQSISLKKGRREAHQQRTVAAWRKDKGYTYAADRAVLDGAAVQGSIPPPSPNLSAAATWRTRWTATRKQGAIAGHDQSHACLRGRPSEGSQQGFFITSQGPCRYGADTQLLLLAVDHDCGGLTLPSKWDPRPIAAASCTSEHLVSLLGQCKGDGHKGYFATELLRQYGLSNPTDDVDGMPDTYKRSGSTALVVTMGQALAAKAGIHWLTTSHTSVDVDLYGAAGGGGGGGKGDRVLGRAKVPVGGNCDNTELAGQVIGVLSVSMANRTAQLRAEEGEQLVARRGNWRRLSERRILRRETAHTRAVEQQ